MKRQAFFLFVSSYISSATDEWDAALKKKGKKEKKNYLWSI